jgi:hypothetical protein
VKIAPVDQVFNQVADGEIGRVALASVTELLAGLKAVLIRTADVPDVVTLAAKRTFHHEILRLGQAADQQSDVVALLTSHVGREHGVDPLLALGLDA